MLLGNHPSQQPFASLGSEWVAWHVQWYCYARVAVAEAVKPQPPRPVVNIDEFKTKVEIFFIKEEILPSSTIETVLEINSEKTSLFSFLSALA